MAGEARNFATKQGKAFFDDGDDFHEFVSRAKSFSSVPYTTLPVDKINETVTLLGGDYEIIASYGFTVDGLARAFVSNMKVNGVNALANHDQQVTNANDTMFVTRHFPIITLEAGDNTFILDFGIDADPQTAGMFEAILKFRRLAQNDNL